VAVGDASIGADPQTRSSSPLASSILPASVHFPQLGSADRCGILIIFDNPDKADFTRGFVIT
jgi:hypothetical protein